MPKVPEGSLRTVSPNAPSPTLNTLRFTADDFGAAEARALDRAGREFGQAVEGFVKPIIERQVNDEATEREIQFTRQLERIMFGNPETGETGFSSLQGKAALDAADSVQDQFAQIKSDAYAGASSAVARELKKKLDVREENHRKRMGRALTKAYDDHQQLLSKAVVETNETEAANDYQNPEVYDRSIKSTVIETIKQAKRLGYDANDPVTHVMVRGAITSQFNKVFKNAMAAKDLTTAGRLIQDSARGGKYQAAVDPVVRAAAIAQLSEETVLVSAQELTEEARTLFPGDYLKQREHIKAESDGQLEKTALTTLSSEIQAQTKVDAMRRAALSEALTEANLREKREKARTKAMGIQAYFDVLEAVDRGEYKNTNDVPHSLRYMAKTYMADIKDYIKQAAAPPTNTTEEGFQLLALVHMDPGILARTSLGKARGLMNDSDFSVFRKLKTDSLKGISDPTVATLTQKLNARMNLLGFNASKKNYKIRGAITSLVYAEIGKRGGVEKMTSEEIDSVIQDVTKPTNLRTSNWFMRHVVGSPTKGDDSKAKQYMDIDEEERARLADLLKKDGKPSTPSDVLKLYQELNK